MCLWVGVRLAWVWLVSRGWRRVCMGGCVGGCGRGGGGGRVDGVRNGGWVGWGSRVGRGNLFIGGCVAGTGMRGVGE